MKKIMLRLSVVLICLLLLASGGYLALSVYYRDGFSYGTWINGIYCTGKNIDEINQELMEQYEIPDLPVFFRGEENQIVKKDFPLKELSCEISFENPLKMIQSMQNPFLWGKNLFGVPNKTVLPERNFDLKSAEKKIEQFLKEQEQKAGNQNPGVLIQKTDIGYVLQDNTKNILEIKKAKEFLLKALAAGESQVHLENSLCYYDLELTEEMQQTYALWDKIEAFQDFSVTYLFGEETEKVDAAVVCEWMKRTEDGDFVLDKEGAILLDDTKIEDYILSLASKYDTLNGTRTFKTTRGDVVTVEGGTYGNKMNQKKEVSYLKNAYLNNIRDTNHIPEYESVAKQQGSNDIGTTYLEIDMTQQQMYYYVDGKQVIKTPIVTGNMARKMDTPARTCFVYAKQRNRILKGPGYASHVNYWMPVNRGIGIHDAKWRKEFGGTIYQTKGSHGCINTPYDIMKELYEMVEVGTPVIMFY